MSQTTAPQRNMAAGAPGLAAEPFGPEDIRSCINTTNKLYFGRMTVVDGEDKAKHPTASGQKALGVVMGTHALMQNGTDEPGYAPKRTANIMRKGYIWVAIDTDVLITDPVYFRHTANGAKTKLGAFGPAADTATCDLLTSARWVKAGTAALGYALLELGSL